MKNYHSDNNLIKFDDILYVSITVPSYSKIIQAFIF